MATRNYRGRVTGRATGGTQTASTTMIQSGTAAQQAAAAAAQKAAAAAAAQKAADAAAQKAAAAAAQKAADAAAQQAAAAAAQKDADAAAQQAAAAAAAQADADAATKAAEAARIEPAPSIVLPSPTIKNINVRNTDIEICYFVEDTYAIIKDGQGVLSPSFGWLGDSIYKKSAFVDVKLCLKTNQGTEDIVRRVYLDSSIKSYNAISEEVMNKQSKTKCSVYYKVTFNPFELVKSMSLGAINMLDLMERNEEMSAYVVLTTGFDKDVYFSMTDQQNIQSFVGTQRSKYFIRNGKITNYSRSTPTAPPIMDTIVTDELVVDKILRTLKNSRVFNKTSKAKTVHADSLYQKERSFASYFSPLFISEEHDGEVRGMFFFDESKFIEQYKGEQPRTGVVNTAKVSSIKITRQRITPVELSNDFSSNVVFRKFDDSVKPENVMEVEVADAESISAHSRNISTSTTTHKAYCFCDKQVSFQKAGAYSYRVEVSIKDDSAEYFARKLEEVRSKIGDFDKYISFVETQGQTIDPATGLFVAGLLNVAEAWWASSTELPPWQTMPTEIVRVIQENSSVLDIDLGDYILPLLRVCHPSSGTPHGLNIVKFLAEQAAGFYEEKLALFGRNMVGGKSGGQVGKTSPSSGTGDYEKTTKFEYTFSEHINRDSAKKLRAQYFPGTYYDPQSQCLLELSSYLYSSKIINSELKSLFGQKRNLLPSVITSGGKEILTGITLEENDTTPTFLTPTQMCVGDKKYIIDEFLEQPDEDNDERISEERAQMYMEDSSVDERTVLDDFMKKYGASLMSLSNLDVEHRVTLPIGENQAKLAASLKDRPDNSQGAEISRETMNNFLNGLVDGEMSDLNLKNPIVEAGVLPDSNKLKLRNFKGEERTFTEEEFNSFPTHIKCVLLYLTKTSTQFDLDSNSYVRRMADNFESSVDEVYDARFFYELFMKQIQRVQFLSGFQKNDEGTHEYQAPVFKDLSYENLAGTPNGKLLCRITPYENSLLGYDAREGLDAVPTEEYFVLDYIENTFKQISRVAREGAQTNQGRSGGMFGAMRRRAITYGGNS